MSAKTATPTRRARRSNRAMTAVQPPEAVHPHPIRWDRRRQLWVCSQGCPFARPKRVGEMVLQRRPSRAHSSTASEAPVGERYEAWTWRELVQAVARRAR